MLLSFLLFAMITIPAQPSFANSSLSYEEWLSEFKKSALKQGISADTLERAFKGVTPQPRVVSLDRKQPETIQTLEDYISARVTSSRIKLGRKLYKENQALLQKIEDKYKVQGRFIIAFWGMETNYGRYTGGHYVIEALTTLAYDGRRSRFFRKQLLDALTILEQGHVTVEKMTGSWAGAMGQTQFMPSTFRAYATDGDGDGKINLWESKADAFSSAANYLSSIGWKNDQTWGREVTLPKHFDRRYIKNKTLKTLQRWQEIGVRKRSGQDLPKRNLKARVIQPDGKNGRAFIVYPANYNAILNWNRSHKFAIAIGTLADAIVR